VKTFASPSKEKPDPNKTTGMFEAGEPVRGVSTELVYTSETKRAIYTGTAKEPAELLQKSGNIKAERITVDDSTRNLEAKGNVDQKFRTEAKSADGKTPGKPTQQTVKADSLVYDDAARTATYTGNATMTNDEGLTEGQKITVFLAKADKSIQRLEVEGPNDNVFAQLSGGNEVRGDRLTYDAATEMYHVFGKPVLVKSPAKDRSGCVISRGPEVKLNRRLNTVEWPPGRTDAVGTDELVKCEVSIRKPAGR
jgi:lipopolysaccharide export system protein LptA